MSAKGVSDEAEDKEKRMLWGMKNDLQMDYQPQTAGLISLKLIMC